MRTEIRKTRVTSQGLSEYTSMNDSARYRGLHVEDETDIKPPSSNWQDLRFFVIAVVILLFVRMFLFNLYVIPSGSMLDTLQIGDRVVTSRLTPSVFSVKRGDIVVFKDPANWLGNEKSEYRTQYLIKRVIGVPGDHVRCCTADGDITINGKAVDERSYIRPGVAPSDFQFDITVTPNHLFVMGDNRSNSADSRFHVNDGEQGLVPIDDVVGVAEFVYWPITQWKYIGRDDSVYDGVPSAR